MTDFKDTPPNQNAAAGICRLGKTGARSSDLRSAVRQAHVRPGITGLGAAWQLAGGAFDGNGYPVGLTRPLTIKELAKVVKRSARMLEAVDKGLLKKGPATVKTSAKATGFYPPGGPRETVTPPPPSERVVDEPPQQPKSTAGDLVKRILDRL